MNIEINNVKWEIVEVNNEEMNAIVDKYRKREDYEYFRGFTCYVENKIYLNTINNIDMEYVLRHELIHAYLYSTGMYCLNSYSEEDVCDITSRSSSIVNKIVSDYFNKIIINTGIVPNSKEAKSMAESKKIIDNINKYICNQANKEAMGGVLL